MLDAAAGDRVARGLLFLTNHPALFVATALVGNSAANYMISLATVIAMSQVFASVPEAAEIIASHRARADRAGLWRVVAEGAFSPCAEPLAAPRRRAVPALCRTLLSLGGPALDAEPLAGPPDAYLARADRLVLAQRELRQILAEGHEAGILHPAQQSLAHGILAVARKPVRQFLTTAGQMVQVRADMSKQAVLRLAERSHTAVIPVAAGATGRLFGYVRVVDLRLHEGDDLAPIRPLPEVRDDSSHLTALMRLESTGDSLARVVNIRGETVGIVTLERLREPLF